jgi:hypothetical protein
MKLVMGLFSKQPSADSLYENFGKLPEEEQKLFLAKFQEQQPAEQEPEKVEEPQEPEAEEGVTEKVEEPQKEEPKVDKFEEYFKKFAEETEKKFVELKESYDKKFEELTKKHSEKKPFGLAENSKEYKATAKPKETSQDLLNKLFKK